MKPVLLSLFLALVLGSVGSLGKSSSPVSLLLNELTCVYYPLTFYLVIYQFIAFPYFHGLSS